MRIESLIEPRINDKSGGEEPYRLKIMLFETPFPSNYILSREGEVVEWGEGLDYFTFTGTYHECLEKEKEILQKLDEYFRKWMQNFPHPCLKRRYRYDFREGFVLEEEREG